MVNILHKKYCLYVCLDVDYAIAYLIDKPTEIHLRLARSYYDRAIISDV